MYTSLPTCEMKREDEPIYTFGGRQAFKPNFYSSSWGREYLNEKVNREFDKINFRENTTNGDVGMVTSPDGQTQYIRFDEVESTSAAGSHHYANLFVSPYMTKDGTPITSFSDWTKKDTIGVCLLIYNIIQFIYQLMMYNSIIKGCQGYHVTGDSAIGDTISHERLMRWLC
jgi:hypothetical protein